MELELKYVSVQWQEHTTLSSREDIKVVLWTPSSSQQDHLRRESRIPIACNSMPHSEDVGCTAHKSKWRSTLCYFWRKAYKFILETGKMFIKRSTFQLCSTHIYRPAELHATDLLLLLLGSQQFTRLILHDNWLATKKIDKTHLRKLTCPLKWYIFQPLRKSGDMRAFSV